MKIGDLGAGLRRHHLRNDERGAEAGVEAFGDVTSDLDVLTLILADRHVVGVVQQDVGRLEGRIGEEARRHEVGFALGGLVLELGHTTEFSVRHGALHDPSELCVFGHVALHEHRRHVGIEADGEEGGRQFQCVLADDSGSIGDGQGVQVDDSVEGVAFVLATHPVAQGSEIIAEMYRAGGLDARQDSSHPNEASGVIRWRPVRYGGAD